MFLFHKKQHLPLYLPPDFPQPFIEQALDKKYLELMYARLSAYAKLSFLTSSRKALSLCKTKVPVNLNVNVSVVLYSPEDLEVLSVVLLCVRKSEPIPENASFLNKR